MVIIFIPVPWHWQIRNIKLQVLPGFSFTFFYMYIATVGIFKLGIAVEKEIMIFTLAFYSCMVR